MRDRIALPAGVHAARMRSIQPHVPDLVVLIVQQRNFILALHELNPELHGESEDRRPWRALIRRIGERLSGEGNGAALTQRFGRFALENGIPVIADKGIVVLGPIRQAHQVCDGTRTGGRRLEIKGIAAPKPRKIGGRLRAKRGPRDDDSRDYGGKSRIFATSFEPKRHMRNHERTKLAEGRSGKYRLVTTVIRPLAAVDGKIPCDGTVCPSGCLATRREKEIPWTTCFWRRRKYASSLISGV